MQLPPTVEGGIGLALKQALDAMSDIYVVYDSDWRFVYHNKANRDAMRVAGLDPDAAIGKNVWEYMPFLVGTEAHRQCLRAMEGRNSTSWEETYPPEIRLRGRAFPTSDGGVAVVAQNISEEWKAERERQEAADRTATLLKTTAGLAGTVTLDRLARVILTDGAAALNARAGIVGMIREGTEEVEIIASEGYAEGLVEPFKKFPLTANYPLADAIRTGQPLVLRNSGQRGAMYPELTEFSERVGEGAAAAIPLVVNDHVIGGIGFHFEPGVALEPNDLEFMNALAQQFAQAAERARLYEAEQCARLEAEEANRAKTEFLTMMSHELRTPLNAIGGYADLILAGIRGPVTDEQVVDLERIKRSQRHLLSLINDVLNFAKLQAGTVAVKSREINLATLVAGAEALVMPQLLEKHLDYRFVSGNPEDCVAMGDPEKVEQIVLNLLSNAIKFTEAGDMIEVSVDCEDEWVIAKVRDTGAGISPDKIDAVFEPFVQLNRTRTSGNGGTGLGLSISRDLARLMSGDLALVSIPGVGSTFSLRLPRVTA
ncbi:MAG TPA: ATP-binding protein [Gemmatimonadaceae bacterium]|nr:ATP-binding protein [Gemmatimonadaceae bacterium]